MSFFYENIAAKIPIAIIAACHVAPTHVKNPDPNIAIPPLVKYFMNAILPIA